MKCLKRFLKYKYILLVAIIFAIFANINIGNMRDVLQTNLSQGLKSIKVTEEKIKIEEKNIFINAKMPKIHYYNEDVERYINSYIRRNINDSINNQRQLSQIYNNNIKTDINIDYHIVFENRNLLNMVIYREIRYKDNKFKLEKDSYIFDLNTGQRVFLNNLLKENEDYKTVIETYIKQHIKQNKINIDSNKINIDKYTNYEIVDEGLNIYFNPYKSSENNVRYEFKVPFDIFKNKIKIVQTSNIIANIDTQTITKNNKYINSVINIPIIITDNKDLSKHINDEITTSIMKFFNDSQQQAKDYYEDLPEVENKFIANVDFDIKKNSDDILSIMIIYYKYAGGAHGEYENVAYNIDINNGKFISLKDLFKEEIDYKSIINEEIRIQIEDLIKSNEENKGVYEFKSISDNQKFYIQDDNLVIYFDLYEIAPYAAGIPEFTINISKIDHILKPEYKEIFK
ncbi:DUF3298 domain-containing protein [Romboutsia sp. 13368]|uniref:DUF3298 domain-containing protein n=1 Tax=Romboutsia sp. 13368 TaxID=2708053 RepID=UPI0025E646BA|nr:DUF3298 domain-containing protein [Romboutsia sp. 13368]